MAVHRRVAKRSTEVFLPGPLSCGYGADMGARGVATSVPAHVSWVAGVRRGLRSS